MKRTGALVLVALLCSLFFGFTSHAANYIIAFDANGGSCGVQQKVVQGGLAIGELPDATRQGYAFAGWYRDNGLQLSSVDITPVSGGMITVKAHWNAIRYTITLNPMGGNVLPSTIHTTTGSVLSNLTTPTKKGYTFKGWYTEKSGKGTLYTTSTVFQANQDITLYAYWKKANTGKVVLKWKKVKVAKGYQIALSTNKKFKKAQTQTFSTKKNKITIKQLVKGKKYYAKIRAYKKVKGKKKYGSWSSVKAVKAK